jgi:outer membrane lipoprotein-sorting protein
MTKPNLSRSAQRPAQRLSHLWKAMPARALLLAVATLSLSGCYGARIRAVNRVVVVQGVLNATLDQLLTQLAQQDAAIQTMSATVNFTATTGGEHEGEVKENPAFAGYILLRRPLDMHVIMLTPVVRTRAVEMVSDGKQFKLLIPSRNKAVIGADEFSSSGKTGLENLRPYIVRDALLIPTASPDEFVSLTKSSRIIPPASGKKDATEEPDYDITIFRTATDHKLETVRVIHFGRSTLKPFQQDIFDHEGRIVTTVTYDKYQKFGEVTYPTSILLSRPIDEFKLKIDFTKLTFNTKLDDEQFVLKFPEGIPITKM